MLYNKQKQTNEQLDTEFYNLKKKKVVSCYTLQTARCQCLKRKTYVDKA